ncbi:MAG: ABC transporter ATP-binding protein [Fimbriimonadaceae bacterium]|nr:ABC transporter ATP-binding protein [Fimbriimonadaceae bacterium]
MLELLNLTKEYRNLRAVDNLNLTLQPGEIFGFIGPNGAGKTTTIKMIATLLRPTSGEARVNGINVVEAPEKVRSIIGYMPDYFGVYDDVKVWEYLDFFAAAYKIPRGERPRIIDDVLELTDLTGKREAFVEELSRGMKQRLCLAKTLVHEPLLLLLDEPASGLDPRARIEIRELLKELRRMGKTIFVSSHILSELADFCTTIGIIEAGRLIAAGSVEQIIERTGIVRSVEIRATAGLEKVESLLRDVPLVQEVVFEPETDKFQVSFNGQLDDVADLLKTLLDNGVRVVQAIESASDLEEVFLRVTKGQVA